MSSFTKGSSQKKRKLSVEEDWSNDVDDPSEVERQNSGSEDEEIPEINIHHENDSLRKRIKLSPQSEDINGKRGGRVDSDIEEDRSERTADNFEVGPLLKKIKLSPDSNKNKQHDTFIESKQSYNEKDTRQDRGDDIHSYKNISANLFSEEITSDDEILTFQCPENFNVTSLLNRTIDLRKVTKLKDGDHKYVCETVKNNVKKNLNVVLPNKKDGAVFLKLPVVGHLLFREVLKLPKNVLSTFEDDEPKYVQWPVDPIKRHPLLGTQWYAHSSKVRKQIKKHKKLLKRSIRHEKSVVQAEKERKEQKKKLKIELALLKKKQIMDIINS